MKIFTENFLRWQNVNNMQQLNKPSTTILGVCISQRRNNQWCYFIYIEKFITRNLKNDFKQIAEQQNVLIINYSRIYIFLLLVSSVRRSTRGIRVEKNKISFFLSLSNGSEGIERIVNLLKRNKSVQFTIRSWGDVLVKFVEKKMSAILLNAGANKVTKVSASEAIKKNAEAPKKPIEPKKFVEASKIVAEAPKLLAQTPKIPLEPNEIKSTADSPTAEVKDDEESRDKRRATGRSVAIVIFLSFMCLALYHVIQRKTTVLAGVGWAS